MCTRSRRVSHRLPAQEHTCSHTIIARERAHGSTHAHRNQQRASAWPLDTPCSCNAAKNARHHAHKPLQPEMHLHRRQAVPRRGPELKVLGRAPAAERPIMMFSGLVRHRQSPPASAPRSRLHRTDSGKQRVSALDQSSGHAIIAHKRAGGSTLADRKAIRASKGPLDTLESCKNHAFRPARHANAPTTPCSPTRT